MIGFDIESRPSAAVPSQFIQTGLVFLCGAAALMVVQLSAFMASPRHNPVTLIVAHLVVLGFGTLVTFGSLGQMIPVILGESVAAERTSRIAYAQLVPGLLLQMVGFAVWTPWLIAIGGTLLVAGTFVFTLPYMSPLWRRMRHDQTARFIFVSLVYTLLTVSFGIAMALQLHTVWSTWLVAYGLPLHLLLGGLGWFTGIIMGVSFKLFPMFTTSGGAPERHVDQLFILFNGGLFVAIGSAVVGWMPGLVAGLVIVGASFVHYMIAIARLVKRRLRRSLGSGMTQSSVSLAYLGVASVLFGFVLWNSVSGTPVVAPMALQRLIIVAGVIFALGWIGNMVLGMLSKIVPMLVWLDRYSDRAGDANVPTLGQMVEDKDLRVGNMAYQVGLVVLAVGISAGHWATSMAGAVVFLFGVLFLTITLFKVWSPARA